ncbi:patatin-like phospholipase family protein [Microbulbifer sp. MLAF003]|uniref:patatin-like phospholipase family protein n=1 Tax=Microbulbifer sp. MLAF003 TaxID=3032582 RepID=UPI0024ADD069|nr:patatin-like phospholipase family protein [Microbulbifer sp. MLAF003]WHI49471.1 patatin-like phospholipase family protein [Microbulbifer sp. MLAF003]
MFDQVVFAGGGGRCIWQIGFWESIVDEVQLSPRVVSAVSAGGLVAGLLLINRGQDAVQYVRSVFSDNRKNAYWKNLFRDEAVFPQYAICRNGIRELFDNGLEDLRTVAELRLAVTRPPAWMVGPLALTLGAVIYYTDKGFPRSLHSTSATRLGFRQTFYRAQDCSDMDEFEHLILSSSCTPPFTPRLQLNGAEILDGGVVDNVPVAGLDAGQGRVLILLTNRFPGYPDSFTQRQGVQLWTYVQPSRVLPIKVWDFTNPEAVTATLNIGRADGRALLTQLKSIAPETRVQAL